MASNMVEENGNSSLGHIGESASTHNNDDAQQNHMNNQALHHQHNASPSVATSANIVQFIPAQSVQVRSLYARFVQFSCFHANIVLFFRISYFVFWFYVCHICVCASVLIGVCKLIHFKFVSSIDAGKKRMLRMQKELV